MNLCTCPLLQKCLINPNSPVTHSVKGPLTISWLRLQQCVITDVYVLIVLTGKERVHTCWPASSYAGMLAVSSRFWTILDNAWLSAFLCLLPISYSYSGVLGLNRGPCSARTLASASVCRVGSTYYRSHAFASSCML